MDSASPNVIFFVGDEPYCLWDLDVRSKLGSFLKGFDPEFFEYQIKVHLDADDERHAAMAIRVAYHHALETLFSLLGALYQAPSVPQAWIAKCSNAQLRQIVRRIQDSEDSLRGAYQETRASWHALARIVFNWYESGSSKQRETTDAFAAFWTGLANEFLAQNRIDEYNGIKHGMRVRPGPFSIAVGIEHEYGVPLPAEEMKSLGGAEYGSSFDRIVRASDQKGERGLLVQSVSMNWTIEQVAPLLQLTTMSISNVLSALAALNGVEPGSVKYVRPQDLGALQEVWGRGPSLREMTWSQPGAASVDLVTREMLLDAVSDAS